MGYEWFDQVDAVVWQLESCVEQAAIEQGVTLGMAPSAGDEARKQLNLIASQYSHALLIEQVGDLSESDVQAASLALAQSAVSHASERGSQHVTREDISWAISDSGTYPYNRHGS